jgi:putative toxin-antitoxin system antitoxin component (TIGR02293 family)
MDPAEQFATMRRIEAYAQTVFESPEVAKIWLSEPNPALDNRAPEDLLLTETGRRTVETLLRRIEHGDYS